MACDKRFKLVGVEWQIACHEKSKMLFLLWFSLLSFLILQIIVKLSKIFYVPICLLNSQMLPVSSKRNCTACFPDKAVHLQQIPMYLQDSSICLLLVELMWSQGENTRILSKQLPLPLRMTVMQKLQDSLSLVNTYICSSNPSVLRGYLRPCICFPLVFH